MRGNFSTFSAGKLLYGVGSCLFNGVCTAPQSARREMTEKLVKRKLKGRGRKCSWHNFKNTISSYAWTDWKRT